MSSNFSISRHLKYLLSQSSPNVFQYFRISWSSFLSNFAQRIAVPKSFFEVDKARNIHFANASLPFSVSSALERASSLWADIFSDRKSLLLMLHFTFFLHKSQLFFYKNLNEILIILWKDLGFSFGIMKACPSSTSPLPSFFILNLLFLFVFF